MTTQDKFNMAPCGKCGGLVVVTCEDTFCVNCGKRVVLPLRKASYREIETSRKCDACHIRYALMGELECVVCLAERKGTTHVRSIQRGMAYAKKRRLGML